MYNCKYEIQKGMVYLRVQFTTTIDENLLKKVKHEAVERGINVNDLLEEIFRERYGEAKKNEGN